jgi:HSP20 family protein
MSMTPVRRSGGPVADMLDWLESGAGLGVRSFGLTPYVRVEDFVEEDGTYVLRAEMPGIDPEKDVEVTVENGVLTIRGERREEEREKGRHELHYGLFTRQLTLPRNVSEDAVTASYTDGVLEVRLPKASGTEAPRTVPVQRSGS